MENSVVKILFGSHLYGTDTLASDLDYKGIFVPSTEDVCLGKIPRSINPSGNDNTRKNAPGELDIEWLSLHHFVKLALEGQTMAIDMLYAPESHTTFLTYDEIWGYLVENRDKFLSKNMRAFIGYARAQAAKYSLKGERLDKLRDFYAIANEEAEGVPLSEIWDELPRDGEQINPQGVRELLIAGKVYGETTAIGTICASVRKIIGRYGNRARAAAEAGGVDWKAMSHALRVSCELSELLRNKNIVFPLKSAPILLAIKNGEWTLEMVENAIDHALTEVEELMAISDLPETADHKFWNDWLVDITAERIYHEYRP